MSKTQTQTIADAVLILSAGNWDVIGKEAAQRLVALERDNAALRAEREELLGILSDVEVITKTHRHALREAQLVERIERALERSDEQ